MKLPSLARLATLVALLPLAGSITSGHAASAHKGPVPAALAVAWLRVDPQAPNRLYALVTAPDGSSGCNLLPMQSSDAGASWTPLSPRFRTAINALSECDSLDPFMVSPTGALYAPVNSGNITSGGAPTLLVSRDRTHWVVAQEATHALFGANEYAISPARPTRLYSADSLVQSPDSGGNCSTATSSSDDGGVTWHKEAHTPGAIHALQIGTIVADPRDAGTYYANMEQCDINGQGDPAGVVADTNGTAHLIGPRGVQDFTVTTDTHEPGMIVGSSTDHGIPADRRYLSSDQGQTWRIATCAGDLQGTCPAFSVDNVFGAGSSYAFFKDGIHAFQLGGPAGPRLAISARLPVAVTRVVDVQAGTHPGDPIYLVATTGGTDELAVYRGAFVYRSIDAGQSWQLLATGLPNVAPASRAPGALVVKATGHSVAPVFVPLYHTLGLRITGYPLTEAFLDQGVLVQIFQHIQLEARGTTVTIGDLGSQVIQAQLAQHNPAVRAGVSPVAPVATTAAVRYFPTTHHTLRGAFLRFWEQHGGMTVFGAPLTEVVTATNGDGSGRRYQMQYFAHGRLEFHPENKDPRYRIELGLLGTEEMLARGWLVSGQ